MDQEFLCGVFPTGDTIKDRNERTPFTTYPGVLSYTKDSKLPPSDFITDLEIRVSDLKQALGAWKEVILPLNTILQWEKQWHPLSIAAFTTILFMMLWLIQPSVLTTLSLLGLTLTVSDYLVPYMTATLLRNEPWTDIQEEEFDRICRSVVILLERTSLAIRSFYLMRSTRPKVYYGASIMSLLILAWLGNAIHNLFLTYIVVTGMLLMPGMQSHGILQRYGSLVTDKIAEMAINAKSTVGGMTSDKKEK